MPWETPPPLPTDAYATIPQPSDILTDDEDITMPSIPSVTEPGVPETMPMQPAANSSDNTLLKQYIASKRPDFVCPYCMREIYKGDLLLFCRRCKRAYSEADAQSAGLGRVVKKQYYCCNESITSKRICPNCKVNAENNKGTNENIRLLPQAIYNAKNEFRVCMTGYSSSGKTQYITRLMDYILKYSLPGIDSTYFLDNKTQEIRDAILKRFFHEGKISGTSWNSLDPLLFDIRKGNRSYISVFYDISGESFQKNYDTLATRCVWNSQNILLVIDPITLPDNGDHPRVIHLKSNGDSRISEGAVVEPLNTYTNFVRSNHPKGERFLKKVNLAIVFPKMDLFYDDEDFPDILKRESSHIEKDQFVVQEVNAVSDAMKHWIRQKGGNALLQALSLYSNVQVFGVSSGSDDLSKESRTNRLLDPYLWLLYQNDIFR